MTDQEPTQEELVDAIYTYAAEQMQNGQSDLQIETSLTQQGLDQETAATVVRNLHEARSQVASSAGAKNMAFGALWCIGGIAVTAFTYSAASEGGGSYVVAWGAILFGGIQFFRGMMQSAGG